MRLAALTIVLALATPSASSPAEAGRSEYTQQPATGSIKVIVRESGSGIPVDGAEVTVNRSGGTGPTAVTDADGTVVIPGLAAGTYIVKVTYKNQLDAAGRVYQVPWSQTRQAVVKRGATATVEFEIRRPATIRGQVLTSEGRPLIGATVAAISVLRPFRSSPVPSLSTNGIQAKTDAEGKFVVPGLTPGRYFLRVTPPPVGNQQLNYVYAPGVTSTAAATALSLDSGDDVAISVTAVALPTINVEGHVVDDAGHNVEGAQIKLRSLEQADPFHAGVSSDREGHFVLTGVRIGTYAVQATLTGGNDSATLVGSTKLEVADKAVAPCEVKVVPGARLLGQLVFNGNEQLDPGRTEIRVRAEGDDRDLRDGLSPAPEWHVDGSFTISGVLGRHRLEVQSNSGWFVERAFLEDGTDVGDGPFNFEPGRIYKNVRVMLSDETAEITGKLPPDWTMSPVTIVAFPADPTLWNDGRYLKTATSSGPQTELTIKSVPPGRTYLVAIFLLPDRLGGPRLSSNPAEFLDILVDRAVSVFADKPGKYSVSLPDPRR